MITSGTLVERFRRARRNFLPALTIASCWVVATGVIAADMMRIGQAAPSDQASVASGKRLFAETCATDHCHGGPARNVADMSDLSAAQVRTVIDVGLPGAGMQPFKGVYTPEQLDQLVAYVLSASGHSGSPAASGPGQGLHGDAARGRALFFEGTQARACISCHALEGTGGRIGPDLVSARSKSPRDLFRSIVMRETHAAAIMPTDEYAARYSLQQLLDLITFLKTPAAGSTDVVALKDVL